MLPLEQHLCPKVTAIHIFKENITLICSKSEADDKTKITAYKDACICAQPNNSKTVYSKYITTFVVPGTSSI